MTIALKPCPLCGGKAEIIGTRFPWIECQVCHVRTPSKPMPTDDINEDVYVSDLYRIKGGDSIKELSEMWNNRPLRPVRKPVVNDMQEVLPI